MKKALSLTLALVMIAALAVVLSSCGDEGGSIGSLGGALNGTWYENAEGTAFFGDTIVFEGDRFTISWMQEYDVSWRGIPFISDAQAVIDIREQIHPNEVIRMLPTEGPMKFGEWDNFPRELVEGTARPGVSRYEPGIGMILASTFLDFEVSGTFSITDNERIEFVNEDGIFAGIANFRHTTNTIDIGSFRFYRRP